MKKVLSLMLASLFFVTGCGPSDEIDPDKIYLFYSDNCPHCHEAMEYIDQKYSGLKVERLNIANAEDREFLFRCAKRYKIGDRIGTPFFIIDGMPMMGWSPEKANQFDHYLHQRAVRMGK